MSLPLTNDITRTMQLIKGLTPADCEALKSGGLEDPKSEGGVALIELQKKRYD